MIEVRDLSKFYGRFRAVENLTFSIGEGEVVGFLGPNGAGKTTTFRVLTCYHPATGGTASVAGHDVFTDSMRARQQVGYLPESVPLYPEMRIREYLRFRGKLRGLDRPTRERRIGEVAQRCWIRDVIDRPIGQLSKGYRQRVGLADALLHNPRVLILDEPTVGLDPVQIRETGELIRELAATHTVMLSSHILPQVEATCQRMIIIHRGRIVAQGTLADLQKQVGQGARVCAMLQGPEKDVLAAARGLPGVSDAQAAARDGWTHVTLSAPQDVSEALLGLCGARGWKVRELRHEELRLEEIFVRCIMAQPDAAEARSRPAQPRPKEKHKEKAHA
ncbi:MAG TPA: ATP-binding cassette domain-containing protein [Phycisphaerae bacterium]|nr:ATP-binding cassette domain-containing protein [Phycisphaerae bacterium]